MHCGPALHACHQAALKDAAPRPRALRPQPAATCYGGRNRLVAREYVAAVQADKPESFAELEVRRGSASQAGAWPLCVSVQPATLGRHSRAALCHLLPLRTHKRWPHFVTHLPPLVQPCRHACWAGRSCRACSRPTRCRPSCNAATGRPTTRFSQRVGAASGVVVRGQRGRPTAHAATLKGGPPRVHRGKARGEARAPDTCTWAGWRLCAADWGSA